MRPARARRPDRATCSWRRVSTSTWRSWIRGKTPIPSSGQMKYAEKGLIWCLIHNAGEALDALAELDDEDLNELASREVFQEARRLHEQVGEFSPSALLARLNSVNAQLITRIASAPQ